MLPSGSGVPICATAECLGRGPHRLGAVKAQNVEPVFEGLDTGPDIIQGALAVIATTVTEVQSTHCVPHRRKCGVDTNKISIIKNNIGSIDVRREVVVLAIQNSRDRVVSVQLVYQVTCRLRRI